MKGKIFILALLGVFIFIGIQMSSWNKRILDQDSIYITQRNFVHLSKDKYIFFAKSYHDKSVDAFINGLDYDHFFLARKTGGTFLVEKHKNAHVIKGNLAYSKACGMVNIHEEGYYKIESPKPFDQVEFFLLKSSLERTTFHVKALWLTMFGVLIITSVYINRDSGICWFLKNCFQRLTGSSKQKSAPESIQ